MSIWERNLETKKEIRRTALKRRQKLPENVRRKYSHMITERVLRHPFFQCADIVLCYVAFREEVDTEELMHHIWKSGKTLAVPKVHGENHMKFYEICSMDELKPGYQGILEPDTDKSQRLPIINISQKPADTAYGKENTPVMILPGSAFDRSGNRIGYGGGFYDAYLQRNPYFYKIGLAFSVQCVERIPAEIYDVGVDVVLTEQGMIRKGGEYADRTAK